MRWMELAWAEQGVCEIKGPEHSPAVLALFKRSGRSDVTNDETAWCGAFVGACLAGAGLPMPPLEQRLMGRAYLKIGTPVEQPRVGAMVVLSRDDAGPHAGHVGFVTGWTETHVAVLGGNQSDAVTVAHFPRSQVLGYRWPEPEHSAEDLAGLGSRIVTEAQRVGGDAVRMARDGAVAAGALVTGAGAGATAPKLPGGQLVETAQGLMGAVKTAQAFVLFCWSSW
ncbi:MAG: TIGR02594 family protein, partial [Gammaproteobacteria bacterium]|nr:TIGR02594 family protein [Gammaproteobacteria bacterium]